MSPTMIFWPAFAQVLLTVIVLLIMGQTRAASLKAKRKSLDDVAMNRPDDWDESATKLANSYKNQFEMPVLFFAAVGMALALKLVDPVLTAFAWLFVLARIAQTAIHIGPNKVAFRGLAFLVGVAALIAMWVLLAVRVAGV
jgi:hypothetical protein